MLHLVGPVAANVRRQMKPFLALACLALVTSIAAASEACSEAYEKATAEASFKACIQAAESGDPDSEFGYALILWSGHGRAARPKEAVEWFRRAAKQGKHLARFSLGVFLTDPRAPPEIRNLSEGYAWLVVGGSTDTAAQVKQRLSAPELEIAEQLAKEFAAKYGPSR